MQVQRLKQNNSTEQHWSGPAGQKAASQKKDLEVLVNKSNMRQEFVFVAETNEHILDCLSKSAAYRLRYMISASYLVAVSYLGVCPVLGS